MSKIIKLDPKNFNIHTDKGMDLLEKSIDEVGVIESITVDKDGTVVTGNARKEVFDKKGFKPKFIELEDNEYPVIQTDLSGEKRVKAALYANTVAKHNLNFDNDLIQEIAVEQYNIDIEEIGVEIINYDQNIESNENRDSNQKQRDFICPECGHEFSI